MLDEESPAATPATASESKTVLTEIDVSRDTALSFEPKIAANDNDGCPGQTVPAGC
jgi:hypothetical protein